ncbi:hypothetical protein DXG01_004172, partial [Tephrocybe rancida]
DELGDKWKDPDAVAELFVPIVAWHKEKHGAYVDEMKVEGTFDKVVGKAQHEFMCLTNTLILMKSLRQVEMKLNGDSNEEAEKDLWIVKIAPSKPERDHSRKVFVAWLKSRILYSHGEPLKKCLKMTMPRSHWPNFAFEHKLCLIEWPSTAHLPDGKRCKYKDTSNGLEQLQINASNWRCNEDYLDKYAIQIVSWDKEDIKREIDNDDLREVPLVTSCSGCRMISADDSEAYMDALAEFNGLTIVKAKKKAPPKAKRNNTILPHNLHNYPADPNHRIQQYPG